MIKITPMVQKWYRYYYAPPQGGVTQITDGLRDVTAEAMRLEFENEHIIIEIGIGKANSGYPGCVACKSGPPDPRHKWGLLHWRTAAHKALIGDKK